MYEQVEKANVLAEINEGADMYVVDIPTQRVMSCKEILIGAIVTFINKPETMFFKAVANE